MLPQMLPLPVRPRLELLSVRMCLQSRCQWLHSLAVLATGLQHGQLAVVVRPRFRPWPTLQRPPCFKCTTSGC